MLTPEIFQALRQAASDDTLDQELKLMFRGVELPFEHSNHFAYSKGQAVHIECTVWEPPTSKGGIPC